MTDPDDCNEVIEIDFEVGHVSIIRSEVTTTHNPPRTHDWKIFLRSAELHGDLTCLIQRCIFHLHPEYPNHKRELKTSPYAIQETGYAGFHLPIDIYFKTKKEPRKFRIEYELDLHRNVDGHPSRQKESYLRKYRCTFHDPDADFREKILAAGGKIVDSGPISSSNSTLDASGLDDELIPRQSPQQKRPASPVSNTNGVANKKLKVEPTSTNTIKKKSIPPVTNKTTTVNIKKPKLVPHKSSSLVDEKVPKTSANKESNDPTDNLSNRLDSSVAKPRPKTMLIKSQSTTNINPSGATTIKKKDPTASPSKVKPVSHSQTVTKKTGNPNPLKKSLKPELTPTTAVKSPLNLQVKQESSPRPSSIAISNMKKIPKKPMVAKTEEKRSHSLKPSSSANRQATQVDLAQRKSIRPITDSQKSQPSISKTKASLKRHHSPSVNTNTTDRLKKTKVLRDPSISSQAELAKTQISSPPKSTRTSPESQLDSAINSTAPPSIERSQSSTLSSPSTQMSSTEDNHVETPMDIVVEHQDALTQPSEKSNSPSEPVKISSTRLSCSDQSDIDDGELSQDSEQDLPSILTDDDLRYKLIYIYKRFQLNSINDLITFVRFFKRHQLIDPNSLLMTKSANEMITYDLFLLNPSQIIELANDLGYTTTDLVNTIE